MPKKEKAKPKKKGKPGRKEFVLKITKDPAEAFQNLLKQKPAKKR